MSDEIEFIRARYFTSGRGEGVRLIVLHTTESPCRAGVARNVAGWFAGPNSPRASAHYVVGPDEVIACVREEDAAWHVPPTNPYSIGIEQAAYARFTAEDWASVDVRAMLDRVAALLHDISRRHAIPLAFVDEEGLRRGDAGVTTHVAVSRAFGRSDHYDPGPAYPIEDVLARAAALGSLRCDDPEAGCKPIPPPWVQG